ncbi:aldehyde dehydrogenase family protein [Bosea sp. (in: a-proteobacteria)]|uniref:aldehyde dehydrogenase family protein n=1 Tax=Bosea sp. (in: a-proteobacteria) TaxID=1871050 RepID=UPI002DDCAC2D|nr:aldehyde dehydrogenase family protein [Bosea sp. (in: a-proteobacteria)]HEV2512102.1 aldehyde dehydrogenase family protein [Bosea sp. (in: a-proteobacteria)]
MNSHTPAAAPHPYLTQPDKGHLIDGRMVPARSGRSFDTVNPATGQVIARLAEGSAEDVDIAVASARRAFEGPWSRFTPYQRQALLVRVHELLDRHFDELALLETLDMGAPLSRTKAFRSYLQQVALYYSSQAVNTAGETLPNSLPGSIMTMSLKAPVGVVGGIIPWNGPLISQWWLLGGALATGCTLVLKPAEDASLSVLRMVELLHEAGMPEGVVNVVTGYGAVAGEALARHPGVDRVAFTGSTETGQRIIEASTSNIKRLQLELGGKSPDIVFADADLDIAVPGAAMAVFNNSGQVCYAGSRLFVERSIQAEFVERLAAFGKTLRVGNGLDPAVNLGPLISQKQLDRVLGYIDIAEKEGAVLAGGGGRLGGELAGGYFVEPTIFAQVRNDMRIAREEIFGPVISVIPFDTPDEALKLANDTVYGLGGAVWTRNIATALTMARGIQSGTVWVNCYGMVDPAVGFGGIKMSGYGNKGGPHHVDAFLYQKNVYINHG